MLAAALLCLVIHVSDGDTLTASCPPAAQTQRQKHATQKPQTLRVRLAGMDAPETRQPYANQARRALRALVMNKKATLRCNKIDIYQRHVCTVWVAPAAAPNGPHTLDVGLAMLTQGMAWWYRHYASEQPPQQRGQYEFAEKQARAKRAGLWASRTPPVPPWEWRAGQRRR